MVFAVPDDTRAKGNALRHHWQQAPAWEAAQFAFSDNFSAFSANNSGKPTFQATYAAWCAISAEQRQSVREADNYRYDWQRQGGPRTPQEPPNLLIQ
jgi:hypothetical protein